MCRNWLLLFQYLSDSFVLEGPKAGGHLGFKEQKLEEKSFSLEESLPKVLEPVSEFEKEAGKKIPVIAAGGIFDGQDIHRFLSMGVSGVQMGARFVATEECDAHQKVKEAFVQVIEEDIEIIKSPVDFPGRAIRSPFLEDVKKGLRKPFKCPFQCVSTSDYTKSPYCIAMALMNAPKGGATRFCCCRKKCFAGHRDYDRQKPYACLRERYLKACAGIFDEREKDS